MLEYISMGGRNIYIDATHKINKIKRNILNRKYLKKELINSDYILSNVNGYSLDYEQRKAIITDECANLIIAGAGSGKSLTIIGKVRYLIEIKNVRVEDILCISFTNDACKNLEINIRKNYNYNIKVYTFHKLAMNILKENSFSIANDNLLKYIVDEYFNSIIFMNKELIYRLKKILGKVNIPYNKLVSSKELINIKKLIITFINLFKTNGYTLDHFLKIKGHDDIIRIIIDIYLLYMEELKSTNSIDFNDMISLAIKSVKFCDINMYKYIIVDEYQDTSYSRYLFLKELLCRTGAKLICVGDDFQSIYRFNGCNLNIFLNFKKYFGSCKLLRITNTYRNSQELINVAGQFIMKNRNQLSKKLKSKKRLEKPIKIMFGDNLNKLLDIVISKHERILVLGRNNFDINKYFEINSDGYFKYKKISIKYLTVHSSKGLEEECVILINLSDNLFGFPNKLLEEDILKYVNNGVDIYPYEEERRLFYVALTRTKNEIYMLVDKKNPSIFIKELVKDSKRYIEYI